MTELSLTYIVPVFNTEPFLLRCLRSIVNQGIAKDDYEVLVVDDGSTDGSRALVQSFVDEGHAQVRLLTQENSGVSKARNMALDHARGRYVYFVDSDDFLIDGMMSALLAQAVNHDLDVLVFNYNRTDVQGNIIDEATGADVGTQSVMTGVEFLQDHSMTPYIWRYLIRRELIERESWRFDTALIVCEDGELIARFMLSAQRVMGNNVSPYCYVTRGDSAMNSNDGAHLRRRIFSQIDSAIAIDKTIKRYQAHTGKDVPASVTGLRNLYLYFSMTKALTNGDVDEAIGRMRGAGLYPFPCVGPEADYNGVKWKILHQLMMRPSLWTSLSKLYCKIKK